MNNSDYFARVAEEWDEIRGGYFTEAMRDAAIELAQLTPKAIVADVGTGTGFVIQGLAPNVAKVYGFDESPEMLVVAQRNLATFPNVELRQAQGCALPLPDSSLDAAFGNMYLHHEPDPPKAIVELARVLHPGGRLVLTDLDAHDQAWMHEEMADRWLGFEREAIRSWFEAAGLTQVTVDDAKGSCRSTNPDGQDTNLSIFVACGRKASMRGLLGPAGTLSV